jgi:hypothetical protein
MGIEKFDFEGVGMVAERVIDGRREKSCDDMVMACRSIGRAVNLNGSRLPRPVPRDSGPAYFQKNET